MDEGLKVPESDANESPADGDPFLMSGTTLAYIGDAVFELKVRKYMLDRGLSKVSNLHKHTTDVVNAFSQSEMALRAAEELSDRELGIFRRGRNAHTLTSAKNQKISDYRRATGIEAVFGYLFLSGQYERLDELFLRCMEIHFETESGA